MAVLQRIDFYYGAIPDPGGNTYHQVLREMRFRILCPKCGPRVQVERADSSEGDDFDTRVLSPTSDTAITGA
jgi:hypothetical protein